MKLSEREKAMTMQKHQTAFVYRLRFERTGSLIYIGHLDLMRTFEHSIRRAGLPILHSQGYNPRPVLVFALPLGVGIATSDDYIDVSLAEEKDVRELIGSLKNFLPEGLRILDGWMVPETAGSIMALVTAASYRLHAPGISAAVRSLMEKKEILVEKRSKGEYRTVDIRPLILHLADSRPPSADEISIFVRAGSRENLRPDLFLSALSTYCGYPPAYAADCEVERTGLFTGTYPDTKSFKEIM